MQQKKLLYILFVLILSSCNTFKSAEKYTINKLEKAGLEERSLETDNYTFSYWDSEEKDKPVLVLFHGFGTSTHLQWFRQAKMLTKTHRVILPNLLYFGSKPKGQAKYTIGEQVKAMSILLDELGVDSMVIGGLSYGGGVAAELAMLKKDKVKKLAIFGSPVKYFTDKDLEKVLEEFGVNDITELLVPNDVATMQRFSNVVLYKDRKIPKGLLEDGYEKLFEKQQNDFKALLATLEAHIGDFNERNYQFECPILLIWGEEDELITRRIGKDLHKYFPSSEFHLIPKAGHIVNIEKKKEFNKILRDFLKD